MTGNPFPAHRMKLGKDNPHQFRHLFFHHDHIREDRCLFQGVHMQERCSSFAGGLIFPTMVKIFRFRPTLETPPMAAEKLQY